MEKEDVKKQRRDVTTAEVRFKPCCFRLKLTYFLSNRKSIDVSGNGILADLRRQLAGAVKSFKNPTSLVFEIADASNSNVPDVNAATYHTETNSFLEHMVLLDGLKRRAGLIEGLDEGTYEEKQDLLEVVERELSRLRDMKLQLWNLSRSDKVIQDLLRGQASDRIRIYDTSERILCFFEWKLKSHRSILHATPE